MLLPISLGPLYEFVCILFRSDNFNCFKGKMTTTSNMKCVSKAESGTKFPKMTTPNTGVFEHPQSNAY